MAAETTYYCYDISIGISRRIGVNVDAAKVWKSMYDDLAGTAGKLNRIEIGTVKSVDEKHAFAMVTAGDLDMVIDRDAFKDPKSPD